MKAVEGFALRPLGREFIVTAEGAGQVNFNKMISLNESAAYLWKEVQGREFIAEDLVKLLLDRYEVTSEVASADVDVLIGKWLEAGMITE